jgi:hypothetical protein
VDTRECADLLIQGKRVLTYLAFRPSVYQMLCRGVFGQSPENLERRHTRLSRLAPPLTRKQPHGHSKAANVDEPHQRLT